MNDHHDPALAAATAPTPGVTAADGSPASALLGTGAVLVWNDVAPDGRDEFYRWHDKEHVPERLALPGFRRGRRFGRPGHSPEFLTMYEADDVAVLTSPEYLARLNAPTAATVSALRHFRNTSRAVCRLALAAGSSTGGHVLALRLGVPADRAAALSRVIGDQFFPAALAQTGVVACHLYSADHAASHVDTAESSTRSFDVPSWALLCESTFPAAAERARALFEALPLAGLGVVVRPDAAVYALEICRLAPR